MKGQRASPGPAGVGKRPGVTMGRPDGSVTMEVLPAAERAVPPTEWIPIAESHRQLASPRWSPDGGRLYSIDARDGFLCIWAQGLDPATMGPRGDPFAVFHAHRNPWRMLGPRGAFSLSVGRHRLVFNAADLTGNVLMAQLPPD